ncbi:hypothetical protein D5018_18035 [Parashewanella curva]|uniref:Uncharacterized protein n=1 Tax=Parashewanella curva TaxID=2338552 RepID=A0A3L8PU16_9GAMM|nr:hypothetical protein [Parashewanella curva]RLV58309.1 hypothetical protein D5018_18035 [Parashewanella curva]
MTPTESINPIQATYYQSVDGLKINVINVGDSELIVEKLALSSGRENKLVIPIHLSPAPQACGSNKKYTVSLFNNGKRICRARQNKLCDTFYESVYQSMLKFFNQKMGEYLTLQEHIRVL